MRKSLAALVAAISMGLGWHSASAEQFLTLESPVVKEARPAFVPFSDWKADRTAQSPIEFISCGNGCEPSCDGTTGCNGGCDTGCGDACGSSCGEACGCDLDACCDPCWNEFESCPGITGYGLLGYDSFNGIADTDYPSNYGASGGGNIGGPIMGLEDRGIGWQAGATFGLYDWRGRSFASPVDQTQNMFFSTVGVFRRADACNPISWSAGFDQLSATRFGVAAKSPYLQQIRVQLGYALSARNEVGVWGTAATNKSSRTLGRTSLITVDYRAVNQLNAYLHHKYDFGGDTWLYAGTTLGNRLAPNRGNLGNFIIGATALAPLSDNLSLYGNFAYMSPSGGGSGPNAIFGGETQYVGIGLVWFPGCNARSCTVGGRTWMPALPVVNNGTMLIDTGATIPVGD